MKTITNTNLTIDTPLYTLVNHFSPFDLMDGFLGNQSAEAFVSISRTDPATANLREGELTEVEAPEFIDTANALITEDRVWTSEGKAVAAVALLRQKGHGTGEIVEFTIRDIVAEIIWIGEAVLSLH